MTKISSWPLITIIHNVCVYNEYTIFNDKAYGEREFNWFKHVYYFTMVVARGGSIFNYMNQFHSDSLKISLFKQYETVRWKVYDSFCESDRARLFGRFFRNKWYYVWLLHSWVSRFKTSNTNSRSGTWWNTHKKKKNTHMMHY